MFSVKKVFFCFLKLRLRLARFLLWRNTPSRQLLLVVRNAVDPVCQELDLLVTRPYNHCVLELGTPLAILRAAGPSIRPRHIMPRAEINHGLDGEHMAWLHHPGALIVRVVRDGWSGVKEWTNAVARVRPHDAAVGLCRSGLNRVANVFVQRVGCNDGDPRHQALKGAVHQLHAVAIRLPDKDCLV